MVATRTGPLELEVHVECRGLGFAAGRKFFFADVGYIYIGWINRCYSWI